MPHPDHEVQTAFDAVRSLFKGEKVPAPPKYYNDANDVLDVIRAGGWILHAFSAPDVDRDNVLRFETWDVVKDACALFPVNRKGMRSEDIDVVVKASETVMQAAMTVIRDTPPGLEYSADQMSFAGMKKVIDPEYAERLIERISVALDDMGGRLENDGAWPSFSEDQVKVIGDIVHDMMLHATSGRMESLTYDRKNPVTVVIYPKTSGDVRSRECAVQALESVSFVFAALADGANRVDRAIRYVRDQAAKAQETENSINVVKQDILAEHGEALRTLGGVAPGLLLAYLKEDKRMPVYKGTKKFPTPEKDAQIDALTSFLNDPSILSELIGSDAKRRLEGNRRLLGLVRDAVFIQAPEM